MIDPDLLAFLEQRFGSMEQRLSEATQQNAALREETAQQFAAMREEFATFRKQVEDRLDRIEDRARQTLVLVEGLRSDIDLMVEGFMAQTERMDRLEKEVERIPDQLKKWFAPYFSNLDARVRALESRAERPQGDVL